MFLRVFLCVCVWVCVRIFGSLGSFKPTLLVRPAELAGDKDAESTLTKVYVTVFSKIVSFMYNILYSLIKTDIINYLKYTMTDSFKPSWLLKYPMYSWDFSEALPRVSS